MRVLLTGASGFVGRHVAGTVAAAGHTVFGTFREAPPSKSSEDAARSTRLELADVGAIDRVMHWSRPEVVIHAAAMPDIRQCEREPDLARRVNTDAAAHLARLSARHAARFIFLSTDQVFDGAAAPYKESAAPNPLHVYGRTKADAEQAVLASGADATVLRVSIVYGRSPSGTRSCTEQIVNALVEHRPLELFTDEFRTPILAEDLAGVIAELIHLRDVPMLNVGGPVSVSRHELGLRVAGAFGLPTGAIRALRQRDVDLRPPRPADLTLDTSLLRSLVIAPPRGLDDGLAFLAAQEVSR